MALADTRAMKWVVEEMKKRTVDLEKKLDIFISNQNDLAKMLATEYELLIVVAKKAGIKEDDFPKPHISMEPEYWGMNNERRRKNKI